MSQENRATPAPPCDPGKELITGHSSRGLDRAFAPAGEPGHIGPIELALSVQLCGQPLNELGIGPTRTTAELMIKMADHKPPIPEMCELMQQRHGIATSGHANQVAAGARKMGDDVWIEGEFLGRRRLHAVTRPLRGRPVKIQGAAAISFPVILSGAKRSRRMPWC